MREQPKEAGQQSSFGKGLAVLAWAMDHDQPRADEIAAALDLPLSSTYRYLRALRERGFLAEDEGAYGAGPRLKALGSGTSDARIAALAMPYLGQLAELTGETAVLTVRHGLDAICVRQVESAHQIRLAFRIGQLLPLYAGAGQRALLAFAPADVQQRVLHGDYRSFTPNTPDRSELSRLLARTRRDGFALSRGELTPGSVSLGMPVLGAGGAICSLCVAGPQNRCGPTWQAAARRELSRASASMAEMIAGSAGER